MLADAYGNPLATHSATARDAWDTGVKRFLGAEPGVVDAFQEAIDEDENFALPHIGLAREMQMRSRPDLVKQHLRRARELSENLDERQRSHVATSTLLLTGKSVAAREAVYEHIKHWPRDIMVAQMCTSIFGLIGLSGLPGREAEQLSYTARLEPHYGDDWWFRAQLAFAQLEVGQLAVAEKNIEIAIQNNPKSAHSAHIRAHLHYEAMQDEEGYSYLVDWWSRYDRETTFFNHIAWHVGLWALEAGDEDRMWKVLDSDIALESSHGPPLNVLTDSAALLFRAELMGIDVPTKCWLEMSEYALKKFPKRGLAFADVHAAIAHSRCGNRTALDDLIDDPRGPAGDVSSKIAMGYREMADENWAKAAEVFQGVISEHARIGGSNAQRDVIDFALAACLVRDGRPREAKTVLNITRPRALVNELVPGL